MEKVCEVCGDGSEGFGHLIATCIQCLSTHEHAYCMRKHVPGVFPEDWICEWCDTAEQSRNEETKAVATLDCIPRARRTKSSWEFHSKKQKPVEHGKVKFIAQDEVIRLSSGASKTKLASIRASTTTNVHHCKCFTNRLQETSSLASAKSPARLKRLADVYTSSPQKVDTCPDSLLSSRNTEDDDAPVAISETKRVGSSSRQLPVPLDITTCGSTSDHSDVQLQNRRDVKHIVGLYGLYLPAKGATWKGGFSIVENGTASEIFKGFQAQPPSKIGRKAYEMSKTLPPIVQLKMLPREQSLAEHFEDNCVDLRHIGLYFFPCEDNVESSRHYELMQRMELREAVMVGLVNGVELMICSSKHLKMDVHRKEFLWGIFCGRRKCLETLSEEEVAMEIDMVGGEDVGTVDVVVPRGDQTVGPDQIGESQVITALKRLPELSSGLSGADQDCPPGFSVKKERDGSEESLRRKVMKTEPH